MSDRIDHASEAEPKEGRSFARSLNRIFRTALIIIPIGVLGNVLFSLLTTEREMLSAVSALPKGYLLAALLLGIIPWITGALRLLIWTRFLGHRASFKDTLEITLATDLGAAVSPTAVGGGFFKWGVLVQRGVSPGVAASLTTLAPFEDAVFFAIALPTAIAITASWGNPVFQSVATQFQENLLPTVLVTLGIALATWTVARLLLGGRFGKRNQLRGLRMIARLRASLRRTWTDARTVYHLIARRGKLRFALSILLTAVHWISRYSIISCLLAFLGAPVHPVLFWLLQWVVFTLAAAIPTPGAAGGAEAAFFVIYSPFIPSELMGLATAGWRFFTFYLLLLLASLLYLLIGGAKRVRPSMVRPS